MNSGNKEHVHNFKAIYNTPLTSKLHPFDDQKKAAPILKFSTLPIENSFKQSECWNLCDPTAANKDDLFIGLAIFLFTYS